MALVPDQVDAPLLTSLDPELNRLEVVLKWELMVEVEVSVCCAPLTCDSFL